MRQHSIAIVLAAGLLVTGCGGQDASSAGSAGTAPSPPAQTIAAPTALHLDTAPGSITLGWAASAGAARYQVTLWQVSGPSDAQAPPAGAVSQTVLFPQFRQSGLEIGRTYAFQVSAVDAQGALASAPVVSAMIPAVATKADFGPA